MTGCDPQFNISGAYFPAWLACILGGVAGTWLLHFLLLRRGVARYLWPAPLIYFALAVAISCALWLLFFAQ
jgi:hypothetical protein